MAGLLVLTLSLGIIQQAAAAQPAIDIIAVSNASNSSVYSVTRVYLEPSFTSRVVETLSPGAHINILGYNSSGTFTAIVKEGMSSISGWIVTSQVLRAYIDGTSLSLAIGYMAQNSASPVATVLTPGEMVKVIGHSVDGDWLAIANPVSVKNPIFWAPRYDIKLPAVVSRTLSLTMVHASPTNDSKIINVLNPTYELSLISRTSDNAWYAVDDSSSGKYIGWVMSGDLVNGTNRELLPTIPAISYTSSVSQSSH